MEGLFLSNNYIILKYGQLRVLLQFAFPKPLGQEYAFPPLCMVGKWLTLVIWLCMSFYQLFHAAKQIKINKFYKCIWCKDDT